MKLLAALLLAVTALLPAPAMAQESDDARILVMLRLAPPHFRAGSGYGGGYGEDGRRQVGDGSLRPWPGGMDCA